MSDINDVPAKVLEWARNGGWLDPEQAASLEERLDAALAQLHETREALRDLARPVNEDGQPAADGTPCWCDLSYMIPYRGHDAGCMTARALTASPGVPGKEPKP